MKNKTKSAFTLVELMVTITIIGVLAAIAVPTYNKYTIKAKVAEAYQGVDVLSKSEGTYFVQHKDFHQYGSWVGGAAAMYDSGQTYLLTPNVYSAKIAHPFPTNTRVRFHYQAFGGQTNGAGVELAGDVDGTGINGKVSTGSESRGPSKVGWCSNTMRASELGVSAAGKPHYNWYLLRATRDLNYDTTECSYVMKIIDTSNGKLNLSNGFITQRLGD